MVLGTESFLLHSPCSSYRPGGYAATARDRVSARTVTVLLNSSKFASGYRPDFVSSRIPVAHTRCSLIKFAIPLLHVSDSSLARAFYCDKLGFRHEFSHRADDTKPDPCYMGLTRDGVWLNLSSFSGDGVSGGVVNLIVDDVDSLHAEFVAKGSRIDVAPVD